MYTQNEHDVADNAALAIGQALKSAREQADISLRDIADRTCLSSTHLSALEAGAFENLPGVGYIPGYIRNYCRAVGLDPTSYIARFKALSGDVTGKPEYSFPAQALVPRVAGSMVAMLTVLVGLGLYVGWTVLGHNQPSHDDPVASSISRSEPPVILSGNEPATPDRPVQPEANSGKADLATVAAQTALVAADQADAAVSSALASDPTVPTSEPTSDLARPGVAAQATARIPEKEVIIRATSSAWIEVTRADGGVLVTKLMRDGDELVLPSDDNLFLSTGNAGGLRLEMINLSAFDAGQAGEILRDLRLNRDSLLTRRAQMTY